jgi:hypothetical protein
VSCLPALSTTNLISVITQHQVDKLMVVWYSRPSEKRRHGNTVTTGGQTAAAAVVAAKATTVGPFIVEHGAPNDGMVLRPSEKKRHGNKETTWGGANGGGGVAAKAMTFPRCGALWGTLQSQLEIARVNIALTQQ